MMQTATADISNPVKRKIQNVRMLLDSGSQITYIAEALAKLKRGVKTEIMVTTFGSKKNHGSNQRHRPQLASGFKAAVS